jgi:type IV secretion system protein VirB10
MTTNLKKSWHGALLAISLLACQAYGQTSPAPRVDTNEPHPATITIPAGTRVLLALTSPLHTTSATAGSGIYSETAAAVVQDSHVVIPLRAQVQGVVQSEQRPGRVKGRAQFLLHFTTLIFPNNYVVSIDGALQSVPGSMKLRTQNRGGTLEPVDQIDKDVATITRPALIGGAIGSIRSLGPGTFTGAGAGALAGLAKVLFTRGDEIRLPAGTTVEMVLQRPLTVELDRTK